MTMAALAEDFSRTARSIAAMGEIGRTWKKSCRSRLPTVLVRSSIKHVQLCGGELVSWALGNLPESKLKLKRRSTSKPLRFGEAGDWPRRPESNHQARAESQYGLLFA